MSEKITNAGWHLLYAFMILGAAIPLLIGIGRAYEGKLFPVTRNTTIVSVQPFNGGSVIHLDFEKIRGCSPLVVNWFRKEQAVIAEDGVADRFERVTLAFLESDSSPEGLVTRPEGFQRAGPWFIDMDPDEVIDQSYSTVEHRCHWFYRTTTIFYP